MLISLVAFLFATAAQDAPPSQGPVAAPSDDRLICRSRPVVGSRVARQRVCKTAEEWRLYRNDLEQARRDNNDQSRGPITRNTGWFPCAPSQPC